MTTNFASLEGEGQNVRQLEQHPAQRARWSDEVISSPESATMLQTSDDLNWRKSSSSFSNVTDASDSFHTPTGDEDMTGWSRTVNDTAEVDGNPFHPGQSPDCSQLYEDYEAKLGDYDDFDDINCNSVSAAGNRVVGRDRRAMYVPSYMTGPELDIETEEFAPPPDMWKKPRLVSSQTEVETKVQRSQHLKFERVESVSVSSSTVVLASSLQTERAEAQIISSPLPRQLMMKSVSRSFDRQSSSSVTSSSPVPSPVTDRGECLVVHPNKRSEITVKTKSKVDSYHGPKYGGSSSFAGAPSDGEPVGKNQTSQSRPSRRSRNDVTVVKAVVSETREYIQATLVESNLAQSEEDDLPASGSGDCETFENEERLLLPVSQRTSDERMAIDMISLEGDGKSGRKGVPSSVQPNILTYEDSDETADQLFQSHQEPQSVEDQNENTQLPSFTAAMDEDKEDAEEEQERQILKGEVEMEIDRSTKEEIMDATGDMVPYDDSMEETRLQRRRSIHPQRKPRESKRKAHTSSRLPPSSSSSSTGGKENDIQAIREVDAYRILPATSMEEYSDARPLHYYSQDSASVKPTSVLPYPSKASDLVEKEMARARPASKSGLDRLKKKTRSGGGGPQSSTNLGNAVNVPQRQEPESKSLDTSQAGEDIGIRMDVVLHKIESGYGLTIEGSQPVNVKAVRKNGIAEKNGILPGDEIVKINGTYVYDWEHERVIKLIRGAGPFLALTLQRDLPGELAQASKDQLSALAYSKIASRPKATQSLKAPEVNHQKPKNQSQVSQSFSSSGKNVRVGTRATDGRGGGGRGEGGSIRNQSPGTAIPSSSEKVELSNKENVSFAPGPPMLLGSSKGRAEQPAAKGAPKPTAVIGMENDDLSEEEDVPINPIFNDLSLLKQNMAHLAVFLNFLISNSEPAPMLFSMIADYYQNSLRETGSATRWAFEIYTTFLATAAPLKLRVDDGMVISIESVLRNAKENELRTVFRPAENFVRETMIMKQLKDFNNKQSIGLGTMFGVQDLRLNMDRHYELRIVDSTLSNHFERFISDEANDTSQAQAFCLATFFRQIGFVGGKNNSLLEACPSFICKDKKVLKYKLKKNYESKGHVFNPYQCTITTITKCQNCEKMIWGIGYQGYQCSNCELVIHRRCADGVWQLCSGTLRRTKDPRRVVRDIMPGRSKSGREDSTLSKSVFHFTTDEAATVPEKRAEDVKPKPLISSNEKVSNGSDDEKQSDSETERKPTNGRPSSWPNIFQENNSVTSKILSVYGKQLSDPDFEVESELPPLSEVISKEALRKLKGKERKKQEYINELFYTEKTHLRQLKVIDRFFRRPLRDEGYNIGVIFKNLDEVIKVHGNLNDAFKKLRAKEEVVTELGDTLVNLFSGDSGIKFRQMASKFCQDQLYVLGYLKSLQKKDQRLFQILQDATLNPHSGRQELKDLLPREMQRLTKYPLLIDNICNCTPPETEEHGKLTLALKSSKQLLEHVNQAVRECENYRRTQDMQKRLDRKPIESSTHPTLLEFRSLDLTQHTMIYDGELIWRRSPRPVDLHMALFEHFVVLLQKQDDRLVLRCQSMAVEDVKFTYSPIIKLAHLMTKDFATDKRAFFLVNKSSDAPQVHELVAKSKEEKNRWCSYIKEAVEKYHKQYSNEGASKRTGPSQPLLGSSLSTASASYGDITDSLPRINQLEVLDLNESVDEQTVEALDLATPNEVSISEVAKESLAAADDTALTELQQKIALINETLCDKIKLLSDGQESSSIGDANTFEDLVDGQQKLDVKELIAQGLDEVKRLSELSRDAELKKLDEENGGKDEDGNVTISATELLKINNRIQQLLALLTVGVVSKEEDHERLESELCASRDRIAAILGDTSIDNSDSRLEMRSPDVRRPAAISRPTSYMAALSETNYKPGTRLNEPSSSMANLEEEAVNQSLLTLEPMSDDIRLTTTQDEWNFDDQRVSTDTVSFI